MRPRPARPVRLRPAQPVRPRPALGLQAGRRWLHVVSRRVPSGGGAALCWTETHADADAEAAPPDLEERLRGRDAAELVASVLAAWSGRPIAEVAQEIGAAGIPPGEVAEGLDAAPGAHALRITRRYLDPSGAPLAVSVSLHPEGRFSYVSRLRRASEAPP